MIETYHEGKTPGSILCGLVYAHGCALLVLIRVYDAKKILVDALGTLRTTGIGFDRFPKFKSKGIEFELGDKYLFWQLTGLLIRQSCQACSSEPLARQYNSKIKSMI
jgi:hypothetical protein